MADVLIPVGTLLICSVLAAIILAARDARQLRNRQEQRPLEDRIASIGASASFMAKELQRVLDRQAVPQPEAVDGIPPVIAYYRRLETLASNQEAPPEEIQQLADEAFKYVQERRLKGIFVAQEARQLADLVRRRNAG